MCVKGLHVFIMNYGMIYERTKDTIKALFEQGRLMENMWPQYRANKRSYFDM